MPRCPFGGGHRVKRGLTCSLPVQPEPQAWPVQQPELPDPQEPQQARRLSPGPELLLVR